VIGSDKIRPAGADVDEPALARLRGRRVVIVVQHFAVGGSERQALLFARALRRAGVDVALWALEGPATDVVAQWAAADDIPVRVVSFRWSDSRARTLAGLWRVVRAVRGARADVLLPYTTVPNVVCGLVAPFAGVRLAAWNQRDLGVNASTGRAQQWIVARAPVFVANSQAVRHYLIERLHAPAARVRVVPNGVALAPPHRGAAEWRRALDLPEGFVAAMVANLHAHKDHATLLRAWARVVPRLALARGPATLVLAGRFDATAPALRALAAELGITETVRFAGPVDDVAGLLSAIDVGVLSSRREGSPNAVLEYMAAGLPVTGTDIDGIRECLGSSATLAPAGDADALAERIVRLASDAALRAAESARNRERARHAYAPAAMCERLGDALLSGLER
jgi:glycosyltransferase involved in cell wall biosynthesis